MSLSRRDLTTLLPALFAAQAAAQKTSNGVLPSKCYRYEDLPVHTNPETHSEGRPVFQGETHGGFQIECHMTKLQPGEAPHAAHKHLGEEMFFVREGTLELTVEGKANHLGPGSVGYVASMDMHGVKNVGDVPAQYFVMELDGRK
jgi:quercetin dioxygenase-like cupin family protein